MGSKPTAARTRYNGTNMDTTHTQTTEEQPVIPAPHSKMSRADMQWLRWAIVCMVVLSVQVLMLFYGQFEALQSLIMGLLPGESGAAEVGTLSPAHTFLISIPLTMYGTVVLLNSNSLLKNLGMSILACIALALPTAVAAMWGIYLHALPLICSVVLMMLLTGFIVLIDKNRP